MLFLQVVVSEGGGRLVVVLPVIVDLFTCVAIMREGGHTQITLEGIYLISSFVPLV